jgi:GNAT superfamily N-acetyltransferase
MGRSPGGSCYSAAITTTANPDTPMQDISIRPFAPGDLADLQRIRAAAFAPVFRSFREIIGEAVAALALGQAEAEQAELLASVCGPDSPHRVHVARIGDAIVGFVSFSLDAEKRIGEIGLNAVHPDHAGKGIGTALYDFAIAEMKRAGMRIATVGVGGDPSHAPARRAYQKAGFGPSLPSHWLYRVL